MRKLFPVCSRTVLCLLLLASTGSVASSVPDQALEFNRRGVDHLDKKEYDAAIKSFRDALKVKPDYSDALDNLGKALDAEGKSAEAVRDFKKVIKLAPDNAIAHNDMGRALFHEKKYQESAAAYRQALAIHNDYPEAYNGLGAALL